MSVSFSQRPGRHERHYRRKLGNPLFVGAPATADAEALFACQRLDHEELTAFLAELRQAVQRAANLSANEDSEVVLKLKAQLDRLYEVSAGLAEDHSANQAGIRELVVVIMRNVERGAAGDPHALDELGQERAARKAHFGLLGNALVADLLHPQSCIDADDLAPSLLSADEDELAAALQLFDATQLTQLYDDARAHLAAYDAPPAAAVDRLAQIAARLA